MTWFAKRCWYCGHRSKEVVSVGGLQWQCLDREVCSMRRVVYHEEYFRTNFGRDLPKK